MSHPAASTPQRLFTFSSGGWVLLLCFFLCLLAAGIVLWPVYQTGFHRAMGDGRNIDTYGFDLSNLTVPRTGGGALIASGKAKDEIHAIPQTLVETATPREVDMMNKNEHIHFIIPPDRVIGVTLNGESRAYPVRILNLHELVNDMLGGVPIAVTWSSLCDSAVVFDRRIDTKSEATEFGVSGLLVNSNPVFFDRRGNAKDESLWPQLAFHAIAGPAATTPPKKLTLIPYELTTWKAWSDAHPDTRVLLGLRTLKQAYGDAQDPFNLYLANDALQFPVDPLWPNADTLLKTPIVATSTDGGDHWKVTRSSATEIAPASTAPANEQRIHAFIFAWYAQHKSDSDYSAFAPQ
jgi:hypothetical protein